MCLPVFFLFFFLSLFLVLYLTLDGLVVLSLSLSLPVDVLDSLSPAQLRNIIRNASGLSGGLFIPDEAFQVVIRRALKRLEHPALRCVQLVYDELMKQAMSIMTPSMSRYSLLGRKLHTVARNTIAARMVETKKLVETLIQMEQALINTHHPNFKENISLRDMLTDDSKRRVTGEERRRRGGGSGGTTSSETKTSSATSSSSSSSSSNGLRDDDSSEQLLIEGWLEKKKSGVMGSRWGRQWVELRNRKLFYSKTDHHNQHQHRRDDSHASTMSSISIDQDQEMMNPLMNNSSEKEDGKTIALNGGSVDLLEDSVSFIFTPSIGKQITMRCPDQITAQKWVHSISIALSDDTWQSYVNGNRKSTTRMRSPSAHAMVTSGKTQPQGKIISHGARRAARHASGSMSDNDIVQAQIIEHLLDSYYDIVKTKIQDSVPKAITLKLVNEVKKVLHTELVSQCYGNEEEINKMLAETENAQQKRDQLKSVLALMEEAMHAVNEVQSGI
jgi:dynamin 1-like protein